MHVEHAGYSLICLGTAMKVLIVPVVNADKYQMRAVGWPVITSKYGPSFMWLEFRKLLLRMSNGD